MRVSGRTTTSSTTTTSATSTRIAASKKTTSNSGSLFTARATSDLDIVVQLMTPPENQSKSSGDSLIFLVPTETSIDPVLTQEALDAQFFRSETPPLFENSRQTDVKIFQPTQLFYDSDPTTSSETPSVTVMPTEHHRVFATSTEISTGQILSGSEKPRIVATMSKNIINGFSTSNVLVIRKLISQRAVAESYKIYRKRVFRENSFEKIKEVSLQESRSPIPLQYKDIISQLNIPQKEIFIYEDNSVAPNEVYVYRIAVKWNASSSGDSSDSDSSVSSLIPFLITI